MITARIAETRTPTPPAAVPTRNCLDPKDRQRVQMPRTELFAASSPFTTSSFGQFSLYVTDRQEPNGQDVILVKGDVKGEHGVLCRVTSRCMTSTAFDADECDCAAQIRLTMRLLADHGRGVLIYLDQEGRGHGLPKKIMAMRLKAQGFNTYSAFEEMGLPPDVTDYRRVPELLGSLGVLSVSLITNNPAKRSSLERLGVIVDNLKECMPENIPAGALRHLEAKRARGHRIDVLKDNGAV